MVYKILPIAAKLSKFHEQQQLHDSDPITHPAPAPAHLPSLNQSHYGMILSVRDRDNENGLCQLFPAFHTAFSRKSNLRACEICGAVPCTRQVHELNPGEDDEVGCTEVVQAPDFNWQEPTLLDLKQ